MTGALKNITLEQIEDLKATAMKSAERRLENIELREINKNLVEQVNELKSEVNRFKAHDRSKLNKKTEISRKMADLENIKTAFEKF